MSAAIFSLSEKVRVKRESLAAGGQGTNDSGIADKWKVIRALGEARSCFALSDRTIAVLEALVSVLPGKELDITRDLIVFPSNNELSARTNGMAPATLRRHLAALVEANLILRRDSANGKRYCRRDDTGTVSEAFGFDLSPLALMAAEIFEASDVVKADTRLKASLRSEITIHGRDIGKVIEAAVEEGRKGDWQGHAQALMTLYVRQPRDTPTATLAALRDRLLRLRAEVESDYLNALSLGELDDRDAQSSCSQNMSANDGDCERHIQNSNTDIIFDKCDEQIKKQTADGAYGAKEAEGEAAREGIAERAAKVDSCQPDEAAPEQKAITAPHAPTSIPLAYFLSCCPQLNDYAKNGLRDWRDVSITAALVRSMLGISPDAYEEARSALGETGAAIAIAAILERADEIRSAGGYLRALTAKAAQGKFSLWPMLEALKNR